ncbi:hypothetical protein GCM10009587_02890 [Microbacterium maritypicum]
MACVSRYRVRPDQTAWLTLPLVFPWRDFVDDVSWAAEVAGDRALAEAPAAVRTAIAESALTLVRAEPPLPGVQERFWWLPSIGGAVVVAHLTAVELDESLCEQPLESLVFLGAGGMVQNITEVEGSAFDTALDCVLLVAVEDSTIALRRLLGRTARTLLMLDVFVDDGGALHEAQHDISSLFTSIEVVD